MTLGTRSLLYGAHQFVLHPLMVANAWRRLYGMPWDPRLWVAFFVHDLGYLGAVNIDGPEGQRHPALGARIMAALFGPAWGAFTGGHSRAYAAAEGIPTSRLCVADKLAFVLTPDWLYLPMAWATGELVEYMAATPGRTPEAWHRRVASLQAQWVSKEMEATWHE